MSDSRADELRRRILAEVAAAPSPTRAEVRRKGARVLLFASACVVAVALMRGIPELAAPAFAASVVLAPLVAAGFGLSLLRRRTGSSLSGAHKTLLFGGALGPFAIGVGYLFATVGLSLPTHAHTGFIADIMCAMVLLGVGAAVLVAVLRFEAQSEPVSPGPRGVAVGGVVSGVVGAALALQCGESSSLHYGLGHLLPAILLATLGGLLGRRWLAPACEWRDPR